jgi:mRNA interferase MazF
MTTKGREYPTRIPCTFQGEKGQIVLDQIRAVDKKRLVKKLGSISKGSQAKTLSVLQELFAE